MVYWAIIEGETYLAGGETINLGITAIGTCNTPRLEERRISFVFLEQYLNNPARRVYNHRDQHLLRAHRCLGLIVWRLSDWKPIPHSHDSKTPVSQSVRPAWPLPLSHSPSISSCPVRSCEPVKWAATSLSDNYKWHTCSPLSCSSES